MKAPGSRRRGGRFSHRWSWRWSPPRWTERSGGRRRPGSAPQDGLSVRHPACDERPERVSVWEVSEILLFMSINLQQGCYRTRVFDGW